MKRCAASSSSAVVMPGWHFERSMRRQRAWIAPAAAIRSICSWVFLIINARRGFLQLFLHAQGGEQGTDPVVDLVRPQRAVDPPQQPVALVVGHQRLRLRVVLLEAVANDLGLVVIAALQAGAADVANALVLGRIELEVEDVPLLDARAAAAEAAYDLVV